MSGVAAGRYRLDSSVVGGLAGPEEDHLLEYEEEAWLSPSTSQHHYLLQNLLTNLTCAKFYLLNCQRRRLEQGSIYDIIQPAPVYVSWQIFFARNEESVG